MKLLHLLSAATAALSLCSCRCEEPLHALPLGIIGIEEPVMLEPFAEPFPAKIDTGADISSIDARRIRLVKRDGERFVIFTVRMRRTGEEHQYDLPLKREISITRHGMKPQIRYVVMLTVRIGKLKLTREFSLANRKNFNYQVLIGRNVIEGNAVIDPARKNITEAL